MLLVNKVNIIGIPLDLGAENLGVDIGPDAFRHQKIKEKLQGVGFKVLDLGNIKCTDRSKLQVGNPKSKYLQEIIHIAEESASLADSLIRKKERVVALGGDNSISIGIISGASAALDGNLGLIYLDAHGDLNTDTTTLTGNIHGMTLATLLGLGNKDLTNVYKKGPKIHKHNLIHIGGYDFDQAELDLIQREDLRCFTIFNLLSNGMKPLFKSVRKLQDQVSNLWICLDLDVIDSVYAPGAGMPNKAGLSYREITTIADFIGKNCNVVGVDIVEYNPLRDIDNKTAELGIELVAKLLGSNYSWYTNYLSLNKLK